MSVTKYTLSLNIEIWKYFQFLLVLFECLIVLFVLTTQSREYVGFATLPEQMQRKSVKRGFEFTLMVVGKSLRAGGGGGGGRRLGNELGEGVGLGL